MTDPPLTQRLLYRLAQEPVARGTTTGFVSGARLSDALGVTRSAVWKAARKLRELGVEIERLPRQGYRLALPCSPLDAEAIRARLSPGTRAQVATVGVQWHTTSTNADLLAHPPARGRLSLCVAEHQSAGRGRRGRSWLAAPGAALCLSWAWRFETLPAHIGSLGLAVGIAAARTLQSQGCASVGLKWPNDLVTPDGKVGGILIELVSEAAGPALVVIGIGINVALGASLRAAVLADGNRATDLASAGAGGIDRNDLAAQLVDDGFQAVLQWEQQGFAPLVSAWRALDRLHGHPVVVRHVDRALHGIARGVDLDGALLLDDGEAVHRLSSGEASVRPREGVGP